MSANYSENFSEIINNVYGIARVDEQEELQKTPDPFNDKYTTEEQNKRDAEITRLLSAYVDNYEGKTNSNRKYKKVIFAITMGIIIGFSIITAVILIVWTSKFYIRQKLVNENIIVEESEETDESEEIDEVRIPLGEMSSFITVCVSYLALVFGILTIITKYVFPEKEEEYITAIVKLIQENDLANKEMNMTTDGYTVGKANKKNSGER